MVIFRCDMLILLGPLALVMLLAREVHRPITPSHAVSQINFLSTLRTGVMVCVVALLVTILVDSYIWRRSPPCLVVEDGSLRVGCCGLRGSSFILMALKINRVSGEYHHGIGTSPPPFLGFDSFHHFVLTVSGNAALSSLFHHWSHWTDFSFPLQREFIFYLYVPLSSFF